MEKKDELINAFSEKLVQTRNLLDKPLLLLFIRQPNTNMNMFLLDTHITRPTAVIIFPDRKPIIFIGAIEHSSLEPIADISDLRIYDGSLKTLIDELKIILSGKDVYVEYCPGVPSLDRVLHSIYENLSEFFTPISAEKILFELRSIKTSTEIEFIERACQITEKILKDVEGIIREGIWRDDMLRFTLESIAKSRFTPAFDPIVTYGDEASEPHPKPEAKRPLKDGDLLILDVGVKYRGYLSDLTETYLVGGDVREHSFYEKWFKLEKEIISQNLSNKLPKALAIELNKLAEEIGVMNLQKHAYGHGLGVDVHDVYPLISSSDAPFDTIPFRDNMVFTFEPGFYGEFGGFRFEYDYVIKCGRAERLG
ncbi:MAG: M24 family metallopeptidase [bacterium]